jgi:hypothetical protein
VKKPAHLETSTKAPAEVGAKAAYCRGGCVVDAKAGAGSRKYRNAMAGIQKTRPSAIARQSEAARWQCASMRNDHRHEHLTLSRLQMSADKPGNSKMECEIK